MRKNFGILRGDMSFWVNDLLKYLCFIRRDFLFTILYQSAPPLAIHDIFESLRTSVLVFIVFPSKMSSASLPNRSLRHPENSGPNSQNTRLLDRLVAS